MQEYLKVQMRCNKVKRRGVSCCTGIYYLESKDPEITTIKLFRRNADHDCDNSTNKVVKKFSEETKKLILEQKKLGNKLDGILLKLRQRKDLSQPTKAQVKHIVDYHGPKQNMPSTVSISQMETFFEKHCEIPEDIDDAFVVNFSCSPPLTPDSQNRA